ncbi:MAG: hypothetical protein HFE39_07010 [Clostridiales bacterium]|jgi:hypothetical protein|nr:hypothetical protein [Clostridiales bacterium]
MQVSEFGEYGHPIVLFIDSDAKMQVCEFGDYDCPTILYLSAKQSKEALRKQLSQWGKEFHIIAPVFHTKKEGQRPQQQAALISQYLKSRYQGKVYAICGFENSWGIVRLILKDSEITSQKVIIETNGGSEPGHFMNQMLQHK